MVRAARRVELAIKQQSMHKLLLATTALGLPNSPNDFCLSGCDERCAPKNYRRRMAQTVIKKPATRVGNYCKNTSSLRFGTLCPFDSAVDWSWIN